jgi:hypothetical protein
MQDSIRRYFKICIGVLGSLLSGVFTVSCLIGGSALSPIRVAMVAGVTYQKASQSSQFWFVLFFAGVACVGFAWFAWHAYRS